MKSSGIYPFYYNLKTKCILCILFIIFSGFHQCYSLEPDSLNAMELKLKILSDSIWQQHSDTSKLKANEVFCKEFEQVFTKENVFSYPFDSLKGIGRLASGDGKFKIFTWNVPFSDGTSLYCGYILLTQPGNKNLKIIKLKDVSSHFDIAADSVLEHHEWIGALYYTVIEEGKGPGSYYTLLGWHGRDRNTTIKLIEVLRFDDAGEPIFGAPVFMTPDGLKHRYILEYARNISCTLKWDEQFLKIPVGNKGRYSEKKSWMIVMDHLIPINPQLTRERKYFVPSGEIYDAFIFKNGKWEFVGDVKVANPHVPAPKRIQPAY